MMIEDWQEEMTTAVSYFLEVAALSGDEVAPRDIDVEFRAAPHHPSGLPVGKMGVYAFWWKGEWLKIGKAGPNSDARFRSQHYQPGRAASSLANSLCNDERMQAVAEFDRTSCSDWIKANTSRCNLLLDARQPRTLLSLLEAFLHHRLKPRYEG